MAEIINLNTANELQNTSTPNGEFIEIAEEILSNVRTDITANQVVSMPIAELATLGAGVASLIPAFNSITQTISINSDGLYRWVNAGGGNALKMAKNGNAWGAFKTASGSSKFAQFQPVSDVAGTVTTSAAINPAILMIAATLFCIEQKLDSIHSTCDQIRTFLETEKESEIEGDIETLVSIISKYKHTWNNSRDTDNNHNLVLDIQRSARKHMISYQKQVKKSLCSKKISVGHSKADTLLTDLLHKFKYYRLALYMYSMASFAEIILSDSFDEARVLAAKAEIETRNMTYRELFTQCSERLEILSNSSLKANVLRHVGTVNEVAGKLIEKVPVINKTTADSRLKNRGEHLKQDAIAFESRIVESFAQISNPGISVFIEKMDEMIQIYGRTEEIYFDGKKVYLVAG